MDNVMGGRAAWTSERGTLWVLDLDGSAPRSIAPGCAATFDEAASREARLLAAAMGLPDAESVLRRLESGRRCFVVRVEERLAAYGWASFGREYVGELERTFRLLEDEAYIWNCVTLPKYRGKHLYSALLSYMLARLRDEGVRRAWIGTALANRPSVKGIVNAGFRLVISVFYARLFRVHCMWVTPAPHAPPRLVAAARHVVITGREWPLGRLVFGIS